jgi:hypothetical protein
MCTSLPIASVRAVFSDKVYVPLLPIGIHPCIRFRLADEELVLMLCPLLRERMLGKERIHPSYSGFVRIPTID